MPNSIDFEFDWFSNIEADQLEVGMTNPGMDINFSTGKVII